MNKEEETCCKCGGMFKRPENGGCPQTATSVSMPGQFSFGEEDDKSVRWDIVFRVNQANPSKEDLGEDRPKLCFDCIDELCRRAAKLLLSYISIYPKILDVEWEDGEWVQREVENNRCDMVKE